MNLFVNSVLLITVCCSRPTFAIPASDQQQERSTKECPFNTAGPALERANALAKTRLEEFEDAFPASEYGRKYTVGEANDGEIYCDGTQDQKYCNKIHGAWGDFIPQNGTYCAWVMLEFQDPPEFNFGVSEVNSSMFNAVFEGTTTSLVKLGTLEEKVVAVAASGGTAGGDPADAAVIPWPIASIIWKDGNKHAKDWIANIHRPTAQDAGYAWYFTFRGHYKAVECDKIWPALHANNLTADNFTMGGGLFLESGSGFTNFWNAFSDIEDVSSQLLPTECIEECVIGPCPDEYDSGPTSGGSIASVTFQMAGLLATLWNII